MELVARHSRSPVILQLLLLFALAVHTDFMTISATTAASCAMILLLVSSFAYKYTGGTIQQQNLGTKHAAVKRTVETVKWLTSGMPAWQLFLAVTVLAEVGKVVSTTTFIAGCAVVAALASAGVIRLPPVS